MKEKLIKIGVPFAILFLGVMAAAGMVSATANKDNEEKAPPSPPLVNVATVVPEQYQVNIDAWGELRPKEMTQLSSFVTGEVVAIHEAFKLGGLVKQGDVLVNIDDADYRAALSDAESNLAAAQSNLEQEIAAAEVAKEEWSTVSKDKITALALRKPQVLSAKARVKSAEAALARAQRNLERCKVKAPYDALVVSRKIGLGQVVNQGSVLGEVYNVESAEITLPIAGFDMPFLPHITDTFKADLEVEGGSGVTREVKIDRDAGLIDSKTRMSSLIAVLDDPYGLRNQVTPVKFGSYVKVTIPGAVLDNVVVIAQEAVTNKRVWLLDESNQLFERDVTILREEGERLLIGDGLKAGERLVTHAPEFPREGMKVTPSEGNDTVAQVN